MPLFGGGWPVLCVFCFFREVKLRGAAPLEKVFVQEAWRSRVCLTKMAQVGGQPATACLRNVYCLRRKKQGAKSHFGAKRAEGISSGSKLAASRPGFGHGICTLLCQERALESVRVITSPHFSKYKVGSITLSWCLLFVKPRLLIYPVVWPSS